MHFLGITLLASMAVAAPMLEKRGPGVVTITTWTYEIVTQYTTVYGVPEQRPTPVSVAPPAASLTSSAVPTKQALEPVTPMRLATKPAVAVTNSPTVTTTSPTLKTSMTIVVASPIAQPTAPANPGSYSFATLPGATNPNGPCTSDEPCSGDATHYNPSQGIGACGPKNWSTGSIWTDNDDVVAISWKIMGSLSNSGTPDSVNSLCKRSVYIRGQNGGKDTVARVVDKCAGCSGNFDLDMSPALFNKVAPNVDGRGLNFKWYWV